MSKYTDGLDEIDLEFRELGVDELEVRLTELIRLCEQLKAENIRLRARQASLLSERSELVDKNELARSRVESILSRLKETESEV